MTRVTGPYVLIRNYGGPDGWAVEEFDTADAALQQADLSRGDAIARVLTVLVTEAPVNNLRESAPARRGVRNGRRTADDDRSAEG